MSVAFSAAGLQTISRKCVCLRSGSQLRGDSLSFVRTPAPRHVSPSRRCARLVPASASRAPAEQPASLSRRTALAGAAAASTALSFSPGRRVAMAAAASSSASEWLKEDKRDVLHAVYRVGNMDETIAYYKKCFGAKLLRYRDIPDEKYTNAFLGFGPEGDRYFSLELTYNYGEEKYDVGSGFGHFALGVPDIYATVAAIKEAGGKVTRDAGPLKGGTSIIAFVEDNTGYKWELIQKPADFLKKKRDPVLHTMLRVGDLDKSLQYYTEALGMRLIRRSENESQKYTLAFLGYGEEDDNVLIELTHNWGKGSDAYTKGNAYAQIALSTEDVFKTQKQIEAAGGKIVREAGAIPGLGTKIVATVDPDGWKYVFVEHKDFLKELETATGGEL